MVDIWKATKRKRVGLILVWIFILIILDFLLNLFWNPVFLNKITYNLDADSSVFAYGGKLVVEGKLPYRDFWDHKPPAVFYVDAFIIRLMGTSQWSFWWSNVIWLALTTIVLFLILQRLSGTLAAFLASGAFLVCLMYPSYYAGGNMPETYGVLPQVMTIGASFLLFSSGKMRWAFITGLLTAIAFLFKQTEISLGIGAFLAVGVLGLRTRDWQREIKYLALFLLGATIPLILIGLLWALAGAVGYLWDAVIVYNFIYINGRMTLLSLQQTFRILFAELPLMPVTIMTLGAVLVFAIKSRSLVLPHVAGLPGARSMFVPNEETGRQYSFLTVFLALPFGVIFVALGGRNYLHYYISLLPLYATACAYLFMQLSHQHSFVPKYRIIRPISIFILAALGIVFLSNAYLVEKPQMGVRNSLSNLFSGEVPVSPSVQYVLDHTRPDQSILIWGNNIGLYLETGRRNPSRYLYPQPLFLPNSGTESRFDQFFKDIQRNPPELIFGLDATNSDIPSINVPESDLCPGCIPEAVRGMQQLKDYINKYYVLVPINETINVYQRVH
jgi:4-amino-4-deoxy-L-arabinose transferase-like glycosyltransferase